MTEGGRNPTVNIAKLEEAFGVDLAEFEVGETYTITKLLDKLKFGNGTPKLRRGPPPKEDIPEKEQIEEKTLRGNRYLKSETEKLRESYPTRSKEEIMRLIPGRTWISLYNHARVLGVKRTHTAKENDIREGYKKRKCAYTDEDHELLRRIYPHASTADLVAAFPHRTVQALQTHAYSLGVHQTWETKRSQIQRGRERNE